MTFLTGLNMICLYSLNLHSHYDWWHWAFFVYLLAFHVSSFKKHLLKSFAHFLTGLFGFLLDYCGLVFLYILDTNLLPGIWLTNIYFLPFLRFSFYFVDGFCAEAFKFDVVSCVYFATYALGVIAKKSLPRPMSQYFRPLYSSRSFMISGLCLVFNLFWVTFCEWWKVRV